MSDTPQGVATFARRPRLEDAIDVIALKCIGGLLEAFEGLAEPCAIIIGAGLPRRLHHLQNNIQQLDNRLGTRVVD